MSLKENKNLDYIAAKTANKIVSKMCREEDLEKKYLEKTESLATKALGVLQEQGVYALMIYLLKEKAEPAKAICEGLLTALKDHLREFGFQDVPVGYDEESRDILNFFGGGDGQDDRGVLADIDKILLLREFFGLVLIYLRYGAKALQKESEATGSQESES